MPKLEISKEEYLSAGGDPNKMPSTRDVMPDHESKQTVDEKETGEMIDISPDFMLGPYEARPLGAGVVILLQKIRHPMMMAALEIAEDGETPDEPEMEMEDAMTLMFVLVHPDAGELVRWAIDGTFQEQALVWAMGVDMKILYEMIEDAQPWLDDCLSQMRRASGAGAGEKKTRGMTG